MEPVNPQVRSLGFNGKVGSQKATYYWLKGMMTQPQSQKAYAWGMPD